MARWVWLAVLGSGMAAGVNACSVQRQPQTHLVSMEALRYEPQTLAIQAGDVVVWKNDDMFPHTTTSKPGGFDSGAIAAGESWTTRLDRRGTFDYLCTYHPTMKGRLVVE